MRFRLMLGAVAVTASLLTAACAGNNGTLPAAQSPQAFAPSAASANAITNGCFDSGTKPWTFVKGVGIDKSNPASGTVSIVSGGYKSCKHAAFEGTTKDPAPNGFYGVSQTVTVTKAGKLSWWYWGDSTESISYGYQEVTVVVGGKVVDQCYHADVTNTSKAWKEGTCSLSKYAGQKVELQFGVFDNGYDKTHLDWYVSDISLQ
jgi:hypothetical protein